MSQPDEFDAYYLPIDPEELAAIDAATTRALSYQDTDIDVPELESTHPPVPHTLALEPLSPPSPDEFDAYDFSEFTADDFAHIDAMSPSPFMRFIPYPRHADLSERPEEALRIAALMERQAQDTEEPQERASPTEDSRSKAYPKRSPYDQSRSWNHLLSVTDLTGPSWCEVQFDYGLRQKRHRKLGERPESFVSGEGKVITVSKNVAAVNDRTVNRGRSVHKVLEQEIQPEAVHVDITTAEERWALRIINMLNSLQTLTEQGRCREMPVFGLVHGQVVTGIIDEVVRVPIATEQTRIINPSPSRSSPNKRSAPRNTPSTPSSSKRSRQEPTDDQPQITTFFSSTATRDDPGADPVHDLADSLQYSLHLSDTKTRTRPSLPPDEDTFASRMQLMLYHRLLSSLLALGDPSPGAGALDFSLLWQRARVDPARRLSDAFRHQTGLASAAEHDPGVPDLACLADLADAWRHAAAALAAPAVDPTLSLVYRLQPTRRRPKRRGSKGGGYGKGKDKNTGGVALEEQEARDIAAAIQASISDVQPGQGGDDELARALFESLQDSLRAGGAGDGELGLLTHPFGPPIDGTGGADAHWDRGGVDPQLAWALQQSLLPRLEATSALKAAMSETSPGEHAPVAGEVDEASEDTPCGDDNMAHARAPALSEREPLAVDAPPLGIPSPAPDAGASASDLDAPAPAPDEDESTDEEITAAELETEAKILGTKTFALDDALLDVHLARVLAWWHGKRAPEGVDVELTRRCVTCEYRDGCEWRERKADEALARYRQRSGADAELGGSADVDVWL